MVLQIGKAAVQAEQADETGRTDQKDENLTFRIKGFEIEGNTLLGEAELETALKPFVGI